MDLIKVYTQKKILKTKPSKASYILSCKIWNNWTYQYLATYWADKNVRCNAICPGGVENNQSKEFLNLVKKKSQWEDLQNRMNIKVHLWMLSDASSYLNGAIVPVDGGRTAW